MDNKGQEFTDMQQQPGYTQQTYPQQQQPYPQQQQGYAPQPGYAPGYGQQPQMMNTTVVAGQPSQPVVIVQQQQISRSDCLVCSILNLIFCNLLFGAIAVAFSCMARDAYDRGDMQTGDSHMKVVRAMNIVGPIAGVLLIIFIPVYVFVIAVSYTSSYYSCSGYYC